jgi:flagellin-like hook-associated protein FlgL
MLENLTREYHEGTLKTNALTKALDTVNDRLKEFRFLSISMNHATNTGEDRLDAINNELNINREERLHAVRLRQENLLAQQRLKRKLSRREQQRKDKKQQAMLIAQRRKKNGRQVCLRSFELTYLLSSL